MGRGKRKADDRGLITLIILRGVMCHSNATQLVVIAPNVGQNYTTICTVDSIMIANWFPSQSKQNNTILYILETTVLYEWVICC